MSGAQRSNSGCWTCRLRRKKCDEEGPPCLMCTSKSLICHGYGPKPAWKDRGEKEREEAKKLQLLSRRRRSRTQSISNRIPGSSSTAECSTNVVDIVGSDVNSPRPWQNRQLSTSPAELNAFNFLEGPELALDMLNSPDFGNPFDWPDFGLNDPEADCTESQNQATVLRSEPHLCFPSMSVPHAPETHVIDREIELVMHFIGEVFTLQHPSYRTKSMRQKSWLLFLLLRSPSFYYASLSISSYYDFLALPPHDANNNEARGDALREYQKFRTLALSRFSELLEPDFACNSSSGLSLPGEILICCIQIALLEALGKNLQDCQSYLNLAVQSFNNNEELISTNCIPPPKARTSAIPSQLIMSTIPPPVATSNQSPMECNAVGFFSSLLIWHDILSCSTQKTAPLGAEAYRRLLTNEKFIETFRDATGCESWILVTIIDATLLDIWKGEQEALGNLSIRELVSRAEKIESAVEEAIEKLSTMLQSNVPPDSCSPHSHHIQTFIFAHSILVHLHTIVSGSRPGVPEIQQSIDKTISAWKMRWHASISLKTLAWPYCVGASLAVGSQRDIFREVISEASSSSSASSPRESNLLGNVIQIKSVVEECWRGYEDTKVVYSCDWREIVQRLNLSGILFS